MKSIHLCFRVHHRIDLKRYRFFEIGNDHYYYDDYANENAVRMAAEQCYIPANAAMLDMIQHSKQKFKVSFAISGIALELFEQYAPEVIEGFQALAKTGCVEFLATTYAHSLASLYDHDEFARQLKLQTAKIEELFGMKPHICANNALLYSDELASVLYKQGYKAAVIEGARHVLGWKSPRVLYQSASQPKLKLIVRDSKLSDDINYNFSQRGWSEFPLTAEKFLSWIKASPSDDEHYTLFMGYETLGLINKAQSGIFDFFKALPTFAIQQNIAFGTLSDLLSKTSLSETLTIPYPLSWTDEEKDTSAWCGNELQQEALTKLYALSERVNLCSDKWLKSDWLRLQDTNHFYFMNTKHYSNGQIFAQPIPYDSPYEAFMNYMNVLSDFIERVQSQYPTTIENEELNALLKTIHNQEEVIGHLEQQLKQLKKRKKPETDSK